MSASPSCFAVVPAAGRSVRMGRQHKLLMPWRDVSVIDHLLGAYTASQVQRVIVVARIDDHELRRVCDRWSGVDVVTPASDPEDMKHSIQIALEHISKSLDPQATDRWLMSPADLPTLSTSVIDQLILLSRGTESIVVPRFGDRRGHPISLPWSIVPEVFELPGDQGVKHLIDRHTVKWADFPPDQYPSDIDTPEDYRRLTGES